MTQPASRLGGRPDLVKEERKVATTKKKAKKAAPKKTAKKKTGKK